MEQISLLIAIFINSILAWVYDFLRAIRDITPELIVYFIIVSALFIAGKRFMRRSLRNLNQTETKQNADWIQSPSGLWVPSHIVRVTSHSDWWNNFWQGLSTEMFGAVVTTIVLSITLLLLQQVQSIQNERNSILRQLHSTDLSLVDNATFELEINGWLYSGALQLTDFYRVNLSDALFMNANLLGVEFIQSTLDSADFRGANLQYSAFSGSVLKNVQFVGANLQQATFHESNLERSNFESTQLKAVSFEGANLRYIDFADAHFSASTVLPDGTVFDESLGTEQLLRFTDPDNDNFWDPCVELSDSPSYCSL